MGFRIEGPSPPPAFLICADLSIVTLRSSPPMPEPPIPVIPNGGTRFDAPLFAAEEEEEEEDEEALALLAIRCRRSNSVKFFRRCAAFCQPG